MLRVCGITYDHTVNYGSVFQAYALQSAIEKIVLSNGIKCKYTLIPVKKFKDYPKKRAISRLLVLPLVRFNHLQFISFENKIHYSSTKRFSNLKQLNEENDVFVCGSDVIWNSDMNSGVKAYFLDFAEKYKFSYAASFGKSNIDNNTEKYIKDYLANFNSISVREKTGIDILNKYKILNAIVVLDPVFLLKKCDWELLLEEKETNEKYIFVYITHISNSVKLFLQQLCEKTDLKVVYAAAGPKQALKQGMIQVQKPEKWLRLLQNAEYVVTNSFHATAFSVIFHKNFFTVVNGDKSKGINVRMNDLLNSIGLGDRILSTCPETVDLSEINYIEVDEKIDKMRVDSLDFLRQNLEAAYQEKIKLENAN